MPPDEPNSRAVFAMTVLELYALEMMNSLTDVIDVLGKNADGKPRSEDDKDENGADLIRVILRMPRERLVSKAYAAQTLQLLCQHAHVDGKLAVVSRGAWKAIADRLQVLANCLSYSDKIVQRVRRDGKFYNREIEELEFVKLVLQAFATLARDVIDHGSLQPDALKGLDRFLQAEATYDPEFDCRKGISFDELLTLSEIAARVGATVQEVRKKKHLLGEPDVPGRGRAGDKWKSSRIDWQGMFGKESPIKRPLP
jgi:hypothetical protein